MKSVAPVVLFVLTFASVPALTIAQAPEPPYLRVRPIPHGKVQTVPYKSKSLGADRQMVVYTPPGYETSSTRYPVLYLLHGAGSTETSWTERGKAHVILENLMADGRMKPMVVVMPFGYAVARTGAAGRGDPAENKMQREGFTRDLLEDVIPLVDRTFRVQAGRDHRAIGGLSLGGAQALAIGLTHPEIFTRIAAFGSAMGAATNPAGGGFDFDKVLAEPAKVNDGMKLLWMGCGTEDSLFESNQAFADLLAKHKVEHTFRVTRGGHTNDVWQRYLNEVAPLLFQDR
jgi:enterochelin esterase family protein